MAASHRGYWTPGRLLILVGGIGSGVIACIQLLGPLGPVVFFSAVAGVIVLFALLQRRRVADYRRRSLSGTAVFRAYRNHSTPFDVQIDESGLRLEMQVLPQGYAWSEVIEHEIERNRFRPSGLADVHLCLKNGGTERFQVEDPDRFETALRDQRP